MVSNNKKIPMRQCIGCGQMKEKSEMIRVLKTTDGNIILDITGKKNGRGAYFCNQKVCFQKAQKIKGLERSLKMGISKDVYESLEREFEAIETK